MIRFGTPLIASVSAHLALGMIVWAGVGVSKPSHSTLLIEIEPSAVDFEVRQAVRPVLGQQRPSKKKHRQLKKKIQPTTLAKRSKTLGKGRDIEIVLGTPLVYPPESKLNGEEGRVGARVRVSARGELLQVSIVESSGHVLLDRHVLEAMRQAQFRPAKFNGRGVESEKTFRFLFRLI